MRFAISSRNDSMLFVDGFGNTGVSSEVDEVKVVEVGEVDFLAGVCLEICGKILERLDRFNRAFILAVVGDRDVVESGAPAERGDVCRAFAPVAAP
jgi:hypothetical protein